MTKPFGSRVKIYSMADGAAFDESQTYSVAMTSYRANGGGALLKEGSGIDSDELSQRITARHPEIREMLYEFILEHGTVDAELIGNEALIGKWKFVPEDIAEKALSADIKLMFGDR